MSNGRKQQSFQNGKNQLDQATEQFISQDNSIAVQLKEANIDTAIAAIGETTSFKWSIGVKVFNAWLHTKIAANPASRVSNLDMLRLTNEELNLFLAEFVQTVS